MRLLFVGDLHSGNTTEERERSRADVVLKRAAEADMVVFGGDVSDGGRPEQYERFKQIYESVRNKSVIIRGNHDEGNFVRTFDDWYPKGAEVQFEPSKYPIWEWKANWFQMLDANSAWFPAQQRMPAPYNSQVQPPVVVYYDGIGPYYYFEKEGVRFIVLDSSTHHLGQRQHEWLKQTIESSTLPIIIMLHVHLMASGTRCECGCVLWDLEPLLQQFIHNDKIIGVFSGHVHFNSIWDWRGKKLVITAAWGASRFIDVEDGKITYIEPLDNMHCELSPKYDSGMFDSSPLNLHYWYPDGILAKDTFWVFGTKGFFDDALTCGPTHWCWYSADGVGGLVWSLPPELLPDKETWFSLNFRSTTPWKVLFEENGVETVVAQGEAGDNLLATGSFGKGPNRPYRRVILRQEPPACGHASIYMALHDTPKPELIPYK